MTISYGIVKVIDVLNEYGCASGARLNHSKSKGLWLGPWRYRSDPPYGLSWFRSSLKIVGLNFGDASACAKTWDEVSAKFMAMLKKWEPRFLTLRGKKTVLESLAVSTLWHVAKVCPLSRITRSSRLFGRFCGPKNLSWCDVKHVCRVLSLAILELLMLV